MPPAVQDAIGGAIARVQVGVYPGSARPFGEGLPHGIHKIVERHDRETYRAAVVVELPEVVYLLDVMHKKSKKGRATPGRDLQRIRARYMAAREHYAFHFKDSTGQ